MFYLIIAALLVLADQLFKIWIVRTIPLGGRMAFIPSVLGLTHVRNEGAAFSMFSGMQLPIAILTILVSVAIIAALCMGKPKRIAQRLALALVLGGAVGNLLDRLLHGYVVDMFQTLFMNFAVFNIADCCIVVGGILFCVSVIFFGRSEGPLRIMPPVAGEEEAIFEKLRGYRPERGEEHDPTDPG